MACHARALEVLGNGVHHWRHASLAPTGHAATGARGPGSRCSAGRPAQAPQRRIAQAGTGAARIACVRPDASCMRPGAWPRGRPNACGAGRHGRHQGNGASQRAPKRPPSPRLHAPLMGAGHMHRKSRCRLPPSGSGVPGVGGPSVSRQCSGVHALSAPPRGGGATRVHMPMSRSWSRQAALNTICFRRSWPPQSNMRRTRWPSCCPRHGAAGQTSPPARVHQPITPGCRTRPPACGPA